ncbi:hypothetical protein [Agromyces sp. PvR057]|uniref:hypothetical protein n=1 Tax=Agromyces sp. PvR057 TaxID=3156403 RepID=UPI000E252A06
MHRGNGRTRRAGTGRLAAPLAIGAVLLAVAGTAATAAAWTDVVGFGADAGVSDGFDVQARTALTIRLETAEPEWGVWGDIGLPGDPDSDVAGNELITLPVEGVQPNSNYARPIQICNTGPVDAEIVDAEITTQGVLVDATSVLVEAIDLGTVIPADSCRPVEEGGAPSVTGVIQFTSKTAWVDDDPLANPTDQITIRIFCREAS